MTEMIGINSSADGEWDGTESKMVQFHGKDETYGKPPEGEGHFAVTAVFVISW